MNALRSIVVGVDFSECSAAALKESIRLAAWNRAHVHPVHVLDTIVVTDLERAISPIQQNLRDSLAAESRARWADFASSIPGAGSLQLEVAVNNRAAGLLERARHHQADLMILGAFGDRTPEVGLGSVASGVVRASAGQRLRTLIVRHPHNGPFRSIIVCVDFSETSRLALEAAVRVAAQDGASLTILHVFEAPWRVLHFRVPGGEPDAGLETQMRADLESRLREFCTPFQHELSYAKAEVVVLDYGSYRGGIPEYARAVRADLVVLGTRGRTNLRDTLLGSTAERVLTNAPCSVLTVPAPPA
ncbi:MAG: universal stress protein [Phycisphaerae bacterium]|nr:universal stress protein [Phycisphaerae bacterium]